MVLQTHEAVSVLVRNGGLGGVTAQWVAGESVGKVLNRKCWSCKHKDELAIKSLKTRSVHLLIR